MRQEDIIRRLYDIIHEITGMEKRDMDNVILFNPAWNLKPRDVAYIFLLVRERMKVDFPPEVINDISFFTLNNIAERIKNCMVNQ